VEVRLSSTGIVQTKLARTHAASTTLSAHHGTRPDLSLLYIPHCERFGFLSDAQTQYLSHSIASISDNGSEAVKERRVPAKLF